MEPKHSAPLLGEPLLITHYLMVGQLPHHYLLADGRLAREDAASSADRGRRRLAYRLLVEDGGQSAFLDLYVDEPGQPQLALVPVFLTTAWLSPAFLSDEPCETGIPDVLLVPSGALQDERERGVLARFAGYLKFEAVPMQDPARAALPYVRLLSEGMDELLNWEVSAAMDMTVPGRLHILAGRIALRVAQFASTRSPGLGLTADVSGPQWETGLHKARRPLTDEQLTFIAEDFGVAPQDFRMLAARFYENTGDTAIQ
jgi:hypothetical protein